MTPLTQDIARILNRLFGHDTLVSLVTTDGTAPRIRLVDAYYEDGCFYVVTYAKTAKMRQMEKYPTVAIAGSGFNSYGVGENLGYVLAEENRAMMETLRRVFAAWYTEGDVDEKDPDTILLRVRLTDGILFSDGERYHIDFTQKA